MMDNIPLIQPDAFMFLGIATASYFLGRRIKSKVRLFQTLSIPVPFLGGFPVALLILVLRLSGVVAVEFDEALPDLVLKFFLTLIALFGTWKLIRHGAYLSLLFWIAAVFLGIMQAVVGISISELLGLKKHLGILAGTISMIGGYDTVSSFAPMISDADGIANASEIAMGVVTTGMILSMIVGAPLGEYLIARYRIKNPNRNDFDNERLIRSISRADRPFYQIHTVECMKIFTFAFVCIALGEWINRTFLSGIVLPSYVTCMLCALLIRNAADETAWFSVDGLALRTLTKLSLTLFIALSTCSLRLDLIEGIPPIVWIIVFSEFLLNLLFARYVYFLVLGKNYCGMLLAVGGLGFSMGVCANALSNMQSLCEKYGPSNDGFLVLSIVGLILLNISNVFLIQFLMSIF